MIEIVDDKNHYPVMLGIDWVTDMNGVINLKKRKMIFEKKSLRVVVPLDPSEGARYTKVVCHDEMDCIYKITVQHHDWVNPTMDGRILWERDSSCTSDSDEEVKH